MKNSTFQAMIAAVVIVALARAILMIHHDFAKAVAILILFPGMVINLLTKGVHGSWDDTASELLMVSIPALGWFVLFRVLFGWLSGRKASVRKDS